MYILYGLPFTFIIVFKMYNDWQLIVTQIAPQC